MDFNESTNVIHMKPLPTDQGHYMVKIDVIDECGPVFGYFRFLVNDLPTVVPDANGFMITKYYFDGQEIAFIIPPNVTNDKNGDKLTLILYPPAVVQNDIKFDKHQNMVSAKITG